MTKQVELLVEHDTINGDPVLRFLNEAVPTDESLIATIQIDRWQERQPELQRLGDQLGIPILQYLAEYTGEPT